MTALTIWQVRAFWFLRLVEVVEKKGWRLLVSMKPLSHTHARAHTHTHARTHTRTKVSIYCFTVSLAQLTVTFLGPM